MDERVADANTDNKLFIETAPLILKVELEYIGPEILKEPFNLRLRASKSPITKSALWELFETPEKFWALASK